ncbi:MAG TPA: hypothetical protein VF176_02620 [Solirubrobacterales bacterium]
MAIAIVALGLVGCGGSDDQTSTVTSTVTVSSDTGASGVRTYVGTTDQGLPITFTATPRAILDLSFDWRARCEDGQVHENTINLGGTQIYDGAFAMGGVLETGGIAHVDGELHGSEASGNLSRRRGSAFGTNCVTTGVTWSAHAD